MSASAAQERARDGAQVTGSAVGARAGAQVGRPVASSSGRTATATPVAPPAPPTSPTSPPASQRSRPGALAGELRVAVVRTVRRLRLERSSEEITDGQYSVLAALSKLGPLTPGDLAERDHVQPPSMTRTVARLVEMGLAARGHHPTDRRQVLVSITEAGEREVRETRRRRDAWLSKRLAELTPSERATLAEAAEILRRIATR
jgi:DNA-binding MarR family transcriptional regulator